MASEIDVCNGALTLLGHDLITSLTENKRSAKLCNQAYASNVDAVIRAYPWNCATFRTSLAQLTEVPTFGFDHQYGLPSNPYCLRVLQMSEKDMIFKVEGRKLLTDEPTASIIYLGRIGVGEMDSLFISTLSARIAADIALALTNSNSITTAMYQIYKDKLEEAQQIDAQEGSADVIEADSWINARY